VSGLESFQVFLDVAAGDGGGPNQPGGKAFRITLAAARNLAAVALFQDPAAASADEAVCVGPAF